MSSNASQPNARYSHRASMRAMWALAAILAVSYAGDEQVVRRIAFGQDSTAKPESVSAPSTSPAPKAPAAESKPIVEVADPAAPLNPIREADPTPPTDQGPITGEKLPSESTDPIEVQSAPTSQPKATIPPKDDIETILARKGKIVLRDTTLADWMMAIMETWNVDLIFNPSELQKFSETGSFTDHTLEEILKTILTRNGLGYKKVGNVLSIVPQKDIGDINLQQINELITLEFSEPDQIEPTLKLLMSPLGKTQSIPTAKALMVIDLPENVENVKKHIARIEQIARNRAEKEQAETKRQADEARAAQQGTTTAPDGSQLPVAEPNISTVFQPRFVKATDIQEAIASQIGDGIVEAIEAENKLVVTGPRSALEATAQLMRELDVPRPQVRISVMMYDVSTDALELLGFNWRNAGKDRIASNGVPNGLFDVHSAPINFGAGSSSSTSSTSTSSTSSASSTGSTSATPFGGFITSTSPGILGSVFTFYDVTRHFDISAVIQALDQTDGARLLADPTVIVLNLEEAQIRIVSEIPVQQLTQTDGGGSIGTTTFREAGITMSVIPEIADDQWLQLTVSPEFSALRGFTAGGQPIIDRRQEQTKVMMRNGETLTLGGLRKQNQVETVSGVPGLMNIKYLGNLFRSHRTTITESELIIFIRAEIITTGCSMTPREQMASQVAEETLDQIPHASHAPFIPPCNDPYCPYHNPRPRPSQDAVPGEWMESGEPIQTPGDPSTKKYPAPLHGRPGRDVTPRDVQPSPDVSPEQFQVDPNAIEQPDPPPVSVDQSAKFRRQTGPAPQMAMKRLPSVNNEVISAPNMQGPVPNAYVQENASERPAARTDRSNVRVGTNPKERIARTPVKRTTPAPAAGSPPEKKSWTDSIFR
jgi:general secretion pathway protein D